MNKIRNKKMTVTFDPKEWKEVVLSMSVNDGGYQNYKDSVDLV